MFGEIVKHFDIKLYLHLHSLIEHISSGLFLFFSLSVYKGYTPLKESFSVLENMLIHLFLALE